MPGTLCLPCSLVGIAEVEEGRRDPRSGVVGVEGQEPVRRGQRRQMILPLRQGGGKKKDQEIAGWGASVRGRQGVGRGFWVNI